jgi:hypothetical protein
MMKSTEPERKAGRGNDVEGKIIKNSHVFSAVLCCRYTCLGFPINFN